MTKTLLLRHHQSTCQMGIPKTNPISKSNQVGMGASSTNSGISMLFLVSERPFVDHKATFVESLTDTELGGIGQG